MEKVIYLLGAMLVLSGCSFAPNYSKPATVADKEQLIKPGATGAARTLYLKDIFTEHQPLLETLNHALRNNYDLQTSILKLKSANAQTFGARADLLPPVALSATRSTSQVESTSLFTGKTVRQKNKVNKSALGLDSYEVDIWGRKSSEITRLKHESAYNKHSLSAVRLTLLADLSTTWFETLSLIKIWHIYQEKLSSLETIERKINILSQHGRMDPVIYSKFFSGKTNDVMSMTAIEKNISFNLDKIEYLSGFVSPWLNHASWKTINPDFSLPEIPQAISSHVIFNRPDVLAAEEAIKAANGSIGAARAAFLPVFNIYGEAYHPSNTFSDIIGNLTHNWSLSPSVIIPIFSWPKYYANLQFAETQQEISLVNYKDVVANALLDLKDASDALNLYRSHFAYSEKELERHTRNFSKISKRHARGYIDLYSYYEAVDILSTAKIEVESNRKQAMDNVIILLKSIGG